MTKSKQNKTKKPKRKGQMKSDPTGDIISVPGFIGNRAVNKTFRFIRYASLSDQGQAAGVGGNNAYNFTLASVPNYTEFTSLFDQYRIVAIKITFRPRFNVAQVAGSSNDIYPNFVSVIDYDDSNVLSGIADYQQYQTYKITRFDKTHVRFFRPRMALAAYSGAFSSYANQSAQWIDAASTGVQHYGVKFFIEAGVVGQTNLQAWSVEVAYFLEFRQTR